MSKWEDTEVARLQEVIDSFSGDTIPYATVEELGEELGKSTRAVGAKLRALDGVVAKKNATASKWPEDEANHLATLIDEGKTDVEIAEIMGKTVKQVRGKALSMQLMDKLVIVKQEKTEKAKTFTDDETALVQEMAENGEFIEDIAETVGKTVRQVRGKLLSLKLTAPQREKKSDTKTKVYTDEVVAQVKEMVAAGDTAEAIAEALELNPVGLKSWLGRNKLKTADMGTGKAPKYTEEDIAVIERIASEGGTVEQAAEELGRTVQSVRVVAGRKKIKFEKAEKAA